MSLTADLSKRFSPEAERQLVKSGTSLTYIPQAEVVARLNSVFGVDMWSLEIIKVERDANDPDWVVAQVRLMATYAVKDEHGETISTSTFFRDAVGGQKVKRTKGGDIVDLGDEFKGAVSDAMKKAASLLGVGLYLARDEDAMEAEVIENSPPVNPMWTNFVALSSELTKEGKAELAQFWANMTNGAPKPTASTVTDEQLEALQEEAVRIALQGQYVTN